MDSIKKNIKNIINQDKSTQNKEDDTEANTKSKVMGIFILVFIGLWVLLGVIGFIHSLICLGYESTFTDKVLGLIIALLFGPFFYVYYYFNKSYCGRKDTRVNSSFNAKYNNMNKLNTNSLNIPNKNTNISSESNKNNKDFFKNLFGQPAKNNTNKPVNNLLNNRNNNRLLNNNRPLNNNLNQRNNNKPVNNRLNQKNNNLMKNSLNQKNNNLMKNSLNRKNNNRPVNKIEQL